MANTTKLSEAALDLIIQFEVGGGEPYYNKKLKNPSWPGGASGVTIGIGYDLGYSPQFAEDWKPYLSDLNLKSLQRTVGITGSRAKAAVSGVRNIVIPWENAVKVFQSKTLPKYINETLKAFPKSQFLPDDAFGALVSLVFNRGSQVDASPRRREMLNIKKILALGNDNLVDNEDIRDISIQVRSMARLWPNNTKSDNDLNDRRHREADLILNSIK